MLILLVFLSSLYYLDMNTIMCIAFDFSWYPYDICQTLLYRSAIAVIGLLLYRNNISKIFEHY